MTLEHQFPGQLVTSVTYFANFGNQHYNQALNNIDPQIEQQYSDQLLEHGGRESVLSLPEPDPASRVRCTTNRPFRYLRCLTKYPLYGPLYEIGVLGASERYQDVEFKLQKRFSQGYNFLFGYIYIREKTADQQLQ